LLSGRGRDGSKNVVLLIVGVLVPINRVLGFFLPVSGALFLLSVSGHRQCASRLYGACSGADAALNQTKKKMK